MLNSYSESSLSITNTLRFEDRYPNIVLDIKEFDIQKHDNYNNFDRVIINKNIKFVINKNLTGYLEVGIFKIWYEPFISTNDLGIRMIQKHKL